MSEEPVPYQSNRPVISGANVKVMRSFDYCHFEVQLSTTEPPTVPQIDDLRKTAAVLVDKAVEQYKVAKEHFAERERVLGSEWEKDTVEKIRAKSETDRTPEEQARLKDWDDRVHRASREYRYQDDWD